MAEDFLFFKDLFTMYMVFFLSSRKEHQLSLRVVVSHHVITEN